MPDVHQRPSEEQRARLRLAVLDALVLAAERRQEVLDAIAEARDPEEARRSVAELLSIAADSAAAEAVVELRLGRFSQSEVAHLQSERDDLKGRLNRTL